MARIKFTNQQQNNIVLTAANTGTGGGTWSYVNLGGIKMAWITTANLNSSASGGINYTFIPPSPFFTSVTAAYGIGINQTTLGEQYINISNSLNTTSVSVRNMSTGGAATQAISLTLIGT